MTVAPPRPAPSLADLDATDRTILATVAEHRARMGAGPTWRGAFLAARDAKL